MPIFRLFDSDQLVLAKPKMHPGSGANFVGHIAGQGAKKVLLHCSIQRNVEVLGGLLHMPHLEQHPNTVELPSDK
ncbi:hypothetical protein D3C85_1825310 [compost metagenome]